jgi:hypothetical protein
MIDYWTDFARGELNNMEGIRRNELDHDNGNNMAHPIDRIEWPRYHPRKKSENEDYPKDHWVSFSSDAKLVVHEGKMRESQCDFWRSIGFKH